MSLLRDFSKVELNSFGGAWLLTEPTEVTLKGALRSWNVEFNAGRVGTRHGYRDAVIQPFTAGVGIAYELYAWYGPFSQISSTNYSDIALCYLRESGSLNVRQLKTVDTVGIIVTGFGSTARGASFASVGMVLVVAAFDTGQRPTGSQYVLVKANGAAPGFWIQASGNLFSGPLNYSVAPSEPSAGLVTAGTHRYGYLLEFDNGFTTRVSPDTSSGSTHPSISTFAPMSFTSAGSKNVSLVMNPVWPANAVYCSIVMTTTVNLNQYYIVPGSRQAVSGAISNTFLVSISDADLSSQAVDATPYLYWFTRGSWNSTTGAEGAAPFSVRHVALFGDRMAYLTTATTNVANEVDCIYVSERNNYFAITADQHIVQMPGQKPIVTMFRMGTLNYLVGPHEIYSTSDNNDVPVTWPTPRLVDGRHGTPAIHGVEVTPSGNYAWLADQAGLFVFTGAPITELPVSYQQQSDWDRINWSSAYCVKIRDDASNKRVFVMVPLDGATTPSHIMVWDYTDGSTWETVRYSLDSITAYSLGSMELVRNDLPGQATGNQGVMELWVGSTDAAKPIMRRLSNLDTLPYHDATATAITSTYRSCPFPGRALGDGLIQMHHGFAARITGAGNIAPTIYDIDAVRSFNCRTVALATAPDQDILFLADMRSELAFVELSTATVDTHWHIAYLRWYYSPYAIQR